MSYKDPEAQRKYTNTYNRRLRQEKPWIFAFRKRKSRLKKLFGLSLDDFDALWVDQAGLCAICHDPLPFDTKIHIDHCHATDRIRGLLCQWCNVGLGHFRDDPRRLLSAVDYLAAV